ATPRPSPTPAPTPVLEGDAAATGPARDRLHLVGTQLTDADGDRALLYGATLYLLPFYLTDGWLDSTLMVETRRITEQLDSMLDRMAELGMDTIRVPLGTPAWEQWLYPLTKDEWLQRLDLVVRGAEERDMKVVITWWDSLDLGAEWPARHDESFKFMRVVHDRYADDPHVFYEPWNEPWGITWEQWGDATTSTVRFWREELGYRGVLVLDTNEWSWGFDTVQADRVLELDRELLGEANILFAIHRYANDNTCFCGAELQEWENNVGQYVTSYPLVVTELGNSNEGRTPQTQWVDEFASHLVQVHVPEGLNGVLPFLWAWEDLNTMTDYDGVTLTDFGQRVVDHLDPIAG
ncbi:MAG: cellulase family glycosylhydrolase, partial [Acidimicrobiales bacterium]|nr:cellulase family glycosylhydrolase [Acidimicrobiales bacterium]